MRTTQSRLVGTWVDGVLDGPAAFHYPDEGLSQLRGCWVHDAMHEACFFRRGRSIGDALYSADADFPPCEPLLVDPYESAYNYVAPSTLPTAAGEGLFAKVNVPANFLIAYYNGVFVPHS